MQNASLPFSLPLSVPTAAGDIRRWGGIPSGAEPFILQQVQQAATTFCLLIARDTHHANMLERALGFYCRFAETAIDIQIFPDWETLPYDTFSPHEDIISRRLDVLSTLGQRKQGILIVPVSTLIQRLPPLGFKIG